jgi:hypothetical protein
MRWYKERHGKQGVEKFFSKEFIFGDYIRRINCRPCRTSVQLMRMRSKITFLSRLRATVGGAV